MKHTGFRLVAGILLLLLFLAGIAGAVAAFKIAALKNRLAQELGNALDARVEVSSLGLDVWKGQVHAAGITLANLRPGAPWDRGEISQATVRFHWRDLLAPTVPLGVEVSSWHLVLHPDNASAAPAPSVVSAPPASETVAAPINENKPSRGVQVTQLSASQGEVEIDLADGRQVLLRGVAFESARNPGGTWTTQLRAESLSAGALEIGASSVEIRGDADHLTFSNLRMECAQGMITGDGSVGRGGLHEVEGTLQAVGVPVGMLVAVPWQMKLSGVAGGRLTYRGNDQGAQAHGQISLTGARFHVLPFLGKALTMMGLPDITGVEVDHASSDFAWDNHVFNLTNIDIRKTGVVRVAGAVRVDGAGQVDGRLRLGLPDSATAHWPQLQASVFSTASNDYDWTEVHVTGTPDHLQEDLTPRLVAAGIQTGGGLLNQGAQKAIDLFNSFLGR